MQSPVAGRKLSSTEQAEGSAGLVSLFPGMSLSQASSPAFEQVVAGDPVCIGSTCDYSSVFMHMWIALCAPVSSQFASCSSPLLVCIVDVAIHSLRASVHKPQWHTSLLLPFSPSTPSSFQADSPILLPGESSKALPSRVGLMWPASGYFPKCFFTGEARKVTLHFPGKVRGK